MFIHSLFSYIYRFLYSLHIPIYLIFLRFVYRFLIFLFLFLLPHLYSSICFSLPITLLFSVSLFHSYSFNLGIHFPRYSVILPPYFFPFLTHLFLSSFHSHLFVSPFHVSSFLYYSICSFLFKFLHLFSSYIP